MNSKVDIIAVGKDRLIYPQEKSRWFGSVKKKTLRLAFSFYSPDGNEISMPIASMSAYLKRDFPNVEVLLEPVLILRDAEKYSPGNYARMIQDLDADVIAFSIMSPHWYPMEPYFAEIKKLMPDLPIVIGGYQAMLSQEQTIESPSVDYICVGDGEHAIGNLVQHLQGTKHGPADGMWEKLIDSSVYETEPDQIGDLSSLPFPDYDVFEKEDGFKDVNSSIFGPKGKLVLPVMTGRGCPYRCTYCCNTPILDYHVVAGQVLSTDLKESQEVETVEGKKVKVFKDSKGVRVSPDGEDFKMVTAADNMASNGVVHIIDGVLIPPTPKPAAKMNIVELAQSVDDLSTLVAAVVAGDLVDTLSSPGPFTVFAPTNEGFAALGDTVDTLLKPENKDQLVDILTYHVVAGQVLSTDLKTFQRVQTVEGKNVHIYQNSKKGVCGGKLCLTPDGKDFKFVVAADQMASNGVVHVIDGVLLPPSSSTVFV